MFGHRHKDLDEDLNYLETVQGRLLNQVAQMIARPDSELEKRKVKALEKIAFHLDPRPFEEKQAEREKLREVEALTSELMYRATLERMGISLGLRTEPTEESTESTRPGTSDGSGQGSQEGSGSG